MSSCADAFCAPFASRSANPCGRTCSIRCSQRSRRCPASGQSSTRCSRRLLGRDDGARMVDLLFHHADRRRRPPRAAQAERRRARTRSSPSPSTSKAIARRRQPAAPALSVETSDDTGTLTLTFFSARKDYLEKLLPGRRAPLRVRHGGALRRHAADGASRPHRR